MANPVNLSFSPVSEQKWQALVAKLKEQGLTVVGRSGELSKLGIDAYFSYDGVNLSVIHAPFFIGLNGAADRIKSAVQQVLQSS